MTSWLMSVEGGSALLTLTKGLMETPRGKRMTPPMPTSMMILGKSLIIILLWCAGPVSSHLLAGFEVATSSKFKENCESDTDPGKDGEEE